MGVVCMLAKGMVKHVRSLPALLPSDRLLSELVVVSLFMLTVFQSCLHHLCECLTTCKALLC